MARPDPTADDTIRLRQPLRRPRQPARVVIGAVSGALLIGVSAWLVWPLVAYVWSPAARRIAVQPPITRPAPPLAEAGPASGTSASVPPVAAATAVPP
ncbi:MAG TPA: hypothetical protein VMB34_30940, partial [Acetobacteraceae bacterium]|nr:hypothetical protein [Acetobacteraceae bacterium]